MSVYEQSSLNVAAYIDALRKSHYLGAASLTFFLYDLLLTIGDEVKYIHKGSKFNLPKLLYLLNRYYVLTIMVVNTLVILLPAPSTPFCRFGTLWSGIGGIVAKFVPDVWLILRVYAIWGSDKRVLGLLVLAFIANVTVCCTLLGVTMRGFTIVFTPSSERLPGGSGCVVLGAEPHFWITFVSSLSFEVILVTFTIVRSVMHAKAGFAQRDTPLSAYLYRTGIMYFLLMGAVMAFMSATALTPLNEVVLPAQFLSAFVSSVCARMMISIRKVLEGDPHDRFSDLRPSDMNITFDLIGFPTVPRLPHQQDSNVHPLPSDVRSEPAQDIQTQLPKHPLMRSRSSINERV